MKEEDKIPSIIMACGVAIFAIIVVIVVSGVAGVNTYPLWSKSPIPEILPANIQGWIIVFMPIVTVIFGLYVFRYIADNTSEQQE